MNKDLSNKRTPLLMLLVWIQSSDESPGLPSGGAGWAALIRDDQRGGVIPVSSGRSSQPHQEQRQLTSARDTHVRSIFVTVTHRVVSQ